MEYYNEKIAKSTNVELVHISCDQDEAGMKKFMGDASMPFPAVPSAKADKIKLLEPLSPKGVPNYKLVDSDGKVIAEGAEAKTKAAELAAGTAATTAAAQ